MAAAGTGPTPRPSRLSIHWTETANGVKSGQTPATPRLKAAQNAGHTGGGILLGDDVRQTGSDSFGGHSQAYVCPKG